MPHLTSPDPATWLATHLRARFAEHAEPDGPEPEVVSYDEVLADDAAWLRAARDRLEGRGAPAPVAATYLAGWLAGSLAEVVGFGLAAGGCGFLLDPTQVRWHLHPDGWPLAVDTAPRAVVPAGHAWTGLAGVEVGDPVGASVDALVEACGPLVDACHGLAKVGRAGLWNEVGDALGMVLAHQVAVPPSEEHLALLAAAVDRPGVPWKARPRLSFARSERLGRVHVVQKGGCCLYYTRPDSDPADPYCSTCSLREPEVCDARQVAWLEQAHQERVRA
jgi:hypothetical protein